MFAAKRYPMSNTAFGTRVCCTSASCQPSRKVFPREWLETGGRHPQNPSSMRGSTGRSSKVCIRYATVFPSRTSSHMCVLSYTCCRYQYTSYSVRLSYASVSAAKPMYVSTQITTLPTTTTGAGDANRRTSSTAARPLRQLRNSQLIFTAPSPTSYVRTITCVKMTMMMQWMSKMTPTSHAVNARLIRRKFLTKLPRRRLLTHLECFSM